MPLKNSVVLLSLLSIALAVTACSGGFTQEEVDATANAAIEAGYNAGVLDAATLLESAPKKAFLEVLNIYPDTKDYLGNSPCDRPCARVQWLRGDGMKTSSNFYMDSQCIQEVRTGSDMPNSCR